MASVSKSCFLINQIQPIHIEDLKVDHVHIGCILHCRLKGNFMRNPRGMIRIRIEDDKGTKGQLMVYPEPDKTSLLELFTNGTEIHLYEPFYNIFAKELAIHVDPIEHVLLGQLKTFKSKSGEELKKEGNQAFQTKEYRNAIDFYREGISCVEKSASSNNQSNLLSILHSNIAQCFLKIECFSEAIESAKNSLKCNENNIKAKLRLISSLINLQKLSEAKIEFKNLQNNIEDRQDKAELEKKLKVVEDNINGQCVCSEMINQH